MDEHAPQAPTRNSKTIIDPRIAPSVFAILGRYRTTVAWLVLLAVAANLLTLFLPKFIATVIDAYTHGEFDLMDFAIKFGGFSVGIFFFTYLQSIVQIYASERVTRDLRKELVGKISRQDYRFIEDRDPSKLLTNITSDIDSIKVFVAQAVVSLVSSAVIIIGVIIMLLSIDWKLALAVLTIIPVIGGTFFVILGMARALFLQSREVIDRLNKVIAIHERRDRMLPTGRDLVIAERAYR